MLSELSVCCSDFTCSIKSTNWKKNEVVEYLDKCFLFSNPRQYLKLEIASVSARLNDSNGSYTLLKREKFHTIKEATMRTMSLRGVLPF